MSIPSSYGLEQARIQLPHIVAEAHAGMRSVITKHGKPYAAIVPLHDLVLAHTQTPAGESLLALRGTGRGLWGADVGQTVADLRNEWDGA
jgi:prevent-host-death family protein